VPPISSTLDPFAALAEPRRRDLLTALSKGEQPVNTLVIALGWPQPQVSKHLAILREVNLVAVRRRGRERVYSINGPTLKTIRDWTAMFDRFWTHHLDRVKLHAEAAARAAEAKAAHRTDNSHSKPKKPPHSQEH